MKYFFWKATNCKYGFMYFELTFENCNFCIYLQSETGAGKSEEKEKCYWWRSTTKSTKHDIGMSAAALIMGQGLAMNDEPYDSMG